MAGELGWADVVPTLTDAGHTCDAVDLPGSAPDTVYRARSGCDRRFFHDGEPEAAARAAMNLTSKSNDAGDASPHITGDCFGTVPRIYIEALKDR